MKDLAPHILRQRLLIEGIYEREVSAATIADFFDVLLEKMRLTAAGDVLINCSDNMGKPENRGIEAFLPLIESGVALYTWESSRFLSLIIYTCKAYDNDVALAATSDFFQLSQVEYKSF